MAWHTLKPMEIKAFILFLTFIVTIVILEFSILIINFKDRGKENLKSRKRIIFERIIHIISMIGFFCIAYGYFIEPYNLEISRIVIKTSKLKSPLRIIQFSDTHCDVKIRNEKKIVKIINSLKADLVLFTGDTINTPKALNNFRKMMKSLKAKYGKYASLGNYDTSYWKDYDLFKDTGFKVLKDDMVELKKDRDKIFISGISMMRYDYLKNIIKKINTNYYNIFLHHSPAMIEKFTDKYPDLYLCGHLHGGQVALPYYGALITFSKFGKKYESGLYHVNNTYLYVNRGIGMEGGKAPRVRFFSKPEITVIDVVPE